MKNIFVIDKGFEHEHPCATQNENGLRKRTHSQEHGRPYWNRKGNKRISSVIGTSRLASPHEMEILNL